MFQRIVVGYDGSAPARRALGTAIDLARAGGATLVVVTAHDRMLGEDGAAMRAQLPPELRATFDPYAAPHVRLAEAVEEARVAGVKADGVEGVGDPVDAILDEADSRDADLIVVGNRGLGRTRRLMIGSVSTRLAHHTQRSLLVVHDGAGTA